MAGHAGGGRDGERVPGGGETIHRRYFWRDHQGMAFHAADAFLDMDIVLVLAQVVFVAVDAHFVRIFKTRLLAVRVMAIRAAHICRSMPGQAPFAQCNGVAGTAVIGVGADRHRRRGDGFQWPSAMAGFAGHPGVRILTGGRLVAGGVAHQALARLAQGYPAVVEERVIKERGHAGCGPVSIYIRVTSAIPRFGGWVT